MSFPIGPSDNQLYTNALGTVYKYVAADGKWIIVSQEIQGYTGAQGVTGLVGVTGIDGIIGSTGVTGVQGYTGLSGLASNTQIKYLTSNFSSTTTAQQVSDLSFSAVANGIYAFELCLRESAAVIAGFTGPAISSSWGSSLSSTGYGSVVTTLSNISASNVLDYSDFRGFIANNNSAGTYTLVVKQAATLYANGFMRVTKLN